MPLSCQHMEQMDGNAVSVEDTGERQRGRTM